MPIVSNWATSIRGLCDAVLKIDIDLDLVQEQRLGQVFNFGPVLGNFLDAEDICHALMLEPVERLDGTPEGTDLRQRLEAYFEVARLVSEFSARGGEPEQRHGNLQAQVRDRVDNLRTAFMRVYPYLKSRTADDAGERERFRQLEDGLVARVSAAIAEIERNARDQVVGLRQELDDAALTARSAADSAQLAAEAAKAAAGRSAAGEYADIFRTESRSHGRASWGWLVAGVIGATALIIATTIIIKVGPTGSIQEGAVVQEIALKAIALSLGTYFVLMMFKMFRSERHLAVMNQHRHVALQTFNALVEGAGREETRDAVLLETTRAIFAPGNFGIIGGDDQGGQSPLALLEIIRSASKRE